MSTQSAIPDLDAIRSQASDWFAKLRSPHATRAQVREFEQWLKDDPRHRQEFEQIDGLWLQCGDLDHLSQSSPVRDLTKRAVITVPTAVWRRRSVQRWAMAATLVLSLGVAWFMVGTQTTTDLQSPMASEYEVLSTLRGEQKAVNLADGTRLTLNTQTIAKVNYTANERRVILLQGQAGFEVARDKNRPFVVDIEQGTVTALGTAFDIYRAPEGARVTLLEGVVAVTAKAPLAMAKPAVNPVPRAVRLAPGQQVSLTRSGELSDPVQVDVDRVIAWHQGKLKFDETPLSEVIAQSNRYAGQQLILADSALADTVVTGVFDAGQTEDLAKALHDFLGVNVTRDASGNFIIQK